MKIINFFRLIWRIIYTFILTIYYLLLYIWDILFLQKQLLIITILCVIGLIVFSILQISALVLLFLLCLGMIFFVLLILVAIDSVDDL